MTTETARTTEFYDAIDAFQRTHRLPGLQHAQLRGLLAEHLARVFPAVSLPPATDQTERQERYTVAIHDAMEPDLSLIDQEPAAQAPFARAADAVMAVADEERETDRRHLDARRIELLRLNEKHAEEVDRLHARVAELEQAAVSSAVGRPDLRDLIAEALIKWAYRGKDPEHGGILETVRANAYSRADAVLRVLPADQRAAVLAEAIRRVEDPAERAKTTTGLGLGWESARDVLRRMADEEQPS